MLFTACLLFVYVGNPSAFISAGIFVYIGGH